MPQPGEVPQLPRESYSVQQQMGERDCSRQGTVAEQDNRASMTRIKGGVTGANRVALGTGQTRGMKDTLVQLLADEAADDIREKQAARRGRET